MTAGCSAIELKGVSKSLFAVPGPQSNLPSDVSVTTSVGFSVIGPPGVELPRPTLLGVAEGVGVGVVGEATSVVVG